MASAIRSKFVHASLLVVSCALALAAAEVVLRLTESRRASPAASSQGPYGFIDTESFGSPLLFGGPTRYETKPGAVFRVRVSDGPPVVERFNHEGFRGPDYAVPKPAGVFRILALGDSVVQSFTVSHPNTWERVLEESLRESACACEVLNAGIGGFVSWQALTRLEQRGWKYQPDVILVLAGWNDLLFSYLPEWAPGLDLSQIEKAYAERHPSATPSFWRTLRGEIYRRSRVAALVRDARNQRWNERRIEELIESVRARHGARFNEEALKLYVGNLEEIYQAVTRRQARMALILWPALLTPQLLDDPETLKRLTVFWQNFPFSPPEVWEGYNRYLAAQREFASRHPDIIVVDAASAFAGFSKSDRLLLFTDLQHLSAAGNRRLAQVIQETLQKADVLPKQKSSS